MTTSVLVIGGGIAGPVAAMALQAAGFAPTVYEAHARDALGAGSFLNLASNGVVALRAIGVTPALLVGAIPTPRMVLWNHLGKPLGEIPNGDAREPSLTILRGHLHAALRDEAVRRGIPFEAGARCVGVDDADGRVVVRFADGREIGGALAIGADGVHSRVREAVDAAAPRPRYTGQLSIGGVVRGVDVAGAPGAYHMMFGRRGFFGYTPAPSGEVLWFANVASPEDDLATLPAITAASWRDRLCALFDGDAGPAIDLVRASGTIGAYAVHDLPHVPRWHRGRIALIGDAIHATSPSAGQGASLAIEDAIVLARCLRDAGDHAGAFVRFERARRARVERVVAYARRIGSSKLPGPIGRTLRDLMMPRLLRWFVKPSPWLHGYDARTVALAEAA